MMIEKDALITVDSGGTCDAKCAMFARASRGWVTIELLLSGAGRACVHERTSPAYFMTSVSVFRKLGSVCYRYWNYDVKSDVNSYFEGVPLPYVRTVLC